MMTRYGFQQSMYRNPNLLVGVFVLAMGACVLGMVTWKAVAARDAALSLAERDIQNLAHSLAEHAAHTFKAPDVAMTGIADLLKYQNPLPQRFNAHLAGMVHSLPQLREVGVLNTDGSWRYSSLDHLPPYSNADRSYFVRHRDREDTAMLINGPVTSRLTGRPTIILSKRINDEHGNFAGVIVAAIDYDYFVNFYRSFDIGAQGGIALASADGTVLLRWPSINVRQSLSDTPLFRTYLEKSRAGFYKTTSPFDGLVKYMAYEQGAEYGTVVTVARSEDDILANWRANLKRDLMVAGFLLAAVAGMAALLAGQFRYRTELEQALNERKERYRLLADNIADIVIVLDLQGRLSYVSRSVGTLLGVSAESLLGRSCFDMVHADDKEHVIAASAGLTDTSTSRSVRFRSWRTSGDVVWLEINFKLARPPGAGRAEIVGVLRDITKQKALEDELCTVNQRLVQLAVTDGLTGLANRRRFDSFLRDAFEAHPVLSVLMVDIDHFKGFNDSQGHQAGDACLRRIAGIIGSMTAETGGLSARYGGEEFAVVLPDVPEDDAVSVANALRHLVRKLDIGHPAASRGYVTISVGVASKTLTTTDEVSLVRHADIALYEAKSQGRNRTVASSVSEPRDSEASLVPSAMKTETIVDDDASSYPGDMLTGAER